MICEWKILLLIAILIMADIPVKKKKKKKKLWLTIVRGTYFLGIVTNYCLNKGTRN